MTRGPGFEVVVIRAREPSEVPPILVDVMLFFPDSADLKEKTPSRTAADPLQEMHGEPLEKHGGDKNCPDADQAVVFGFTAVNDQKHDDVDRRKDQEGDDVANDDVVDQEAILDQRGFGVVSGISTFR